MAKKRTDIPRATQEAVLREYNHRCAICGADRPHLHHIDEEPSNHDPFNLLPLCPNCHLNDQHNPTTYIELGILRLFRRHKDPSILSPQFFVLYRRLEHVFASTLPPTDTEFQERNDELVAFVKELEKGEYFSKRIGKLLMLPLPDMILFLGDSADEERRQKTHATARENYRRDFANVRGQVAVLIMELLRFQDWQRQPKI